MMNAPEPQYSELVAALRHRREVIADHSARDADPAAHLQSLQEVSLRIETLQRELQGTLEPQLTHFLERCSYDKALALLEGRPFQGH